jgi:hypothetical protein
MIIIKRNDCTLEFSEKYVVAMKCLFSAYYGFVYKELLCAVLCSCGLLADAVQWSIREQN